MSQSFSAGVLPFPDTECEAVRLHLESMLASSVFRNSRRYSGFLRYIVEQCLSGGTDRLKERTIGIEVFGRLPDYDTNADHCVRSAAGEVRKRLAQYYMEAGAAADVRIELQPGSYVPQFRFATGSPAAELSAERDSAPVETYIASGVAPNSPSGQTSGLRLSVFLSGAAVLILCGFTFRFMLQPRTPFEKLWGPLLSSPHDAVLCFGGGRVAPPADNPIPTLVDLERSRARQINLSDALTLAALTGALKASRKPFRILNRAGSASFKDLQQGPFLLIGAMNNEWTLRLMHGLRFTFDPEPSGPRIADKQNPQNTAWRFDYRAPWTETTRDYAIVTRLRDPNTEQAGLIVAGIGSWGTQAAGEFVTDPSQLNKLDAIAPRNWDRKNLQVVIATDIIRGSSGPPIVLAAYFW